MTPRRVAALAAATVLGAGAAVAGAATTVAAAPAGTVLCDQYASTPSPDGRYIIQNNRWGTSAQQCITVTATGFRLTTSNADVPTNGPPASYPSIYWGCHYGNCTPGFEPVRADTAAFAGISSSISMSYVSGGQWDAAYDIWFDPTPRRDGQNTGAEIMVWMNHLGAPQPVGSRVGTVSLAGGTWDVWFGNIGWNVVSYVRTTPTATLSSSVDTFYADAVRRGYAQRSWYLTSVQAGFEPWTNGTGLAVTNFSVSTGGGGPTTPPPVGTGCTATYATTQTWAGGFTADVTVRNTGSAPTRGWTVSWPYGTQTITNAWNATVTRTGGTVRAVNVGHNAAIPPGGTATFGFQAAGTPDDTDPDLHRFVS